MSTFGGSCVADRFSPTDCVSRSVEVGAGDDCLMLAGIVPAVAAIVVGAAADAASSVAVDKCAVDFSNLLNGFCILNDTFVGNLEEELLFVALEALLAIFVVLLVLLLFSLLLLPLSAIVAANVLAVPRFMAGGGGVAGLTAAAMVANLAKGRKSTSLLDASKCGERGPGSSSVKCVSRNLYFMLPQKQKNSYEKYKKGWV